MTFSGNFESLEYFNLETDFLENENLFKKLKYHFLVESTKIKNAYFSYKTAISEASVQITKWTYITNNGVLPIITLFF